MSSLSSDDISEYDTQRDTREQGRKIGYLQRIQYKTLLESLDVQERLDLAGSLMQVSMLRQVRSLNSSPSVLNPTTTVLNPSASISDLSASVLNNRTVEADNRSKGGKKLRDTWTKWPINHRLTPVARLELTKEIEAEFEKIYKDPDISFEGDFRVGQAVKDIEDLILGVALRSGTVGMKKSTRRSHKPLSYQYILAGIARAGLLSVERFEGLTARCDELFGGNTQICITPRARSREQKIVLETKETRSGRVRKG